MDLSNLLPKRTCETCGEVKDWMQFVPRGNNVAHWMPNCSACREKVVREALPELPILTCPECHKARPLPSLLSINSGITTVSGPCRWCLTKANRHKAQAET